MPKEDPEHLMSFQFDALLLLLCCNSVKNSGSSPYPLSPKGLQILNDHQRVYKYLIIHHLNFLSHISIKFIIIVVYIHTFEMIVFVNDQECVALGSSSYPLSPKGLQILNDNQRV